jgi:hypothetical protein
MAEKGEYDGYVAGCDGREGRFDGLGRGRGSVMAEYRDEMAKEGVWGCDS